MKPDTIFAAIILSVTIAITALAQSPSPTDVMLTANRLYEEGQFVEAAQTYEQLVAAEHWDAAVFYNLGNAYFKQGQVGRAILNYRRAQQLAPRDVDVRANLAFAQAQTTDQIPASGRMPFGEIIELTQTWVTVDEMAWMALLVGLLTTVVFGAFLFAPPGRLKTALKRGVIGLAVALALSVFPLAGRLYWEANRPAAVIIAPEVNVTSGPGQQYITEFTLHSGTEVSVVESRARWMRVALPGQQLQGWIPADAVETVRMVGAS